MLLPLSLALVVVVLCILCYKEGYDAAERDRRLKNLQDKGIL